MYLQPNKPEYFGSWKEFEEKLIEIFSPFGIIKKLFNHSKGEEPFYKAFLEFEERNSASLCIDILHQTEYEDIGYIKVFHSDRQTISHKPPQDQNPST